MAILGILFGLSSPYLFGAREKRILENERDRVVNTLKDAQQLAIAAYEGYDYQVVIEPPRTVRLLPANESVTLHPKTIFTDDSAGAITFMRLTGQNFIAVACIGTLIGNIAMLSGFGGETMSAVYARLCISLLTILYGVILSWIICIPMAKRFESVANQGDLERLDYLENGERFALWISVAVIGFVIYLWSL